MEETGVSAELTYNGHEKLAGYVNRPLAVAVPNFDWLPGDDKTRMTQAVTGAVALSAAVSLLEESGLLVVVLYPNHEVGFAEAQSVEEWAVALPQQQFAVLKYIFANRQSRPPYLLTTEKLHQKRMFVVEYAAI